jgi:hypothetical protein
MSVFAAPLWELFTPYLALKPALKSNLKSNL